MQDRLQVSNVNEYPIIDPIIEIERKRTQAYYTIISISDKAAKDLISQLKEEYGSKSENFLKSNRTGPFFYRGTGTGSKTIASYVRFHPIEKKSMVILFDFLNQQQFLSKLFGQLMKYKLRKLKGMQENI